MGKKDLNDFDKAQIIITIRVDQSISEMLDAYIQYLFSLQIQFDKVHCDNHCEVMNVSQHTVH